MLRNIRTVFSFFGLMLIFVASSCTALTPAVGRILADAATSHDTVISSYPDTIPYVEELSSDEIANGCVTPDVCWVVTYFGIMLPKSS